MWHFCREVNNGKIEKINEKAMRILYNEYVSYKELIVLFAREKSDPRGF